MIWNRTIKLVVAALFALGLAGSAHAESSYGVLIMAHGGSPEWNQGVLDAVQPLRDRYPVEVAFGMADACSL